MLDLVYVLHMQIQTLQKNELVLGIIFQGFLVGTDSVLFCTFLVCSYCSSGVWYDMSCLSLLLTLSLVWLWWKRNPPSYLYFVDSSSSFTDLTFLESRYLTHSPLPILKMTLLAVVAVLLVTLVQCKPDDFKLCEKLFKGEHNLLLKRASRLSYYIILFEGSAQKGKT